MAARKRPHRPPIHSSIKESLGYDVTEADDGVYKDWKERSSRVCKPCWELKYCPYGPLVEQLPILPPPRASVEEQQNYYRRCLETNTVGDVTPLSEDLRNIYEDWLADEGILMHQGLYELKMRRRFEELEQLEGEGEQIAAWLGGELPPVHIYRVPYEVVCDHDLDKDDFDPEEWQEIVRLAEEQRERLKRALATGVIDNRSPLEPTRRAWFKRQLEEFDPNRYPEVIPQAFTDTVCTVFGHICPVFFAAEAMTETEQERRIGRRHLSFATMMRIVRRDDYRCQHCQKKLKDNEVEFDHIIPVSKGGSSEEHNLRLTCFDCNRDKSNDYFP